MKDKKPKDKFAALPDTFKNDVGSASLETLKQILAEVAKKEEANQSAKKADPDLNRLKEQVKVASSGYTDVTKMNRLKLKFIIRNLADKGDDVAATIIKNDISAEMQKSM
jgi:hypothetical protein